MRGKQLGGKCAVITGGAAGIGRETALSSLKMREQMSPLLILMGGMGKKRLWRLGRKVRGLGFVVPFLYFTHHKEG